jgi:hypothetical protein
MKECLRCGGYKTKGKCIVYGRLYRTHIYKDPADRKPVSEETKKKISAAHKGRKVPEYRKELIRQSLTLPLVPFTCSYCKKVKMIKGFKVKRTKFCSLKCFSNNRKGNDGKLLAYKKLCEKEGVNFEQINKAWHSLKTRCTVPTNNNYKYYGAKGIGYDKKWKTTVDFLEDMLPSFIEAHKKADGKRITIDRIDVYGDYTKENCRWVDYTTQGNNKTNNRYITYKGKKMTVADAARASGIKPATIHSRLLNGKNGNDLFVITGKKITIEMVPKIVEYKSIYKSKNKTSIALGVSIPTLRRFLKDNNILWENL